MNNINKLNRNQFQFFPYHLVQPSPWPILLSFSLLTMAIGAVMYFHGYYNGGLILSLGFVLTLSGMSLWFRDVITEGIKSLTSQIFYIVFKKVKTMSKEEIENIKNKMDVNKFNLSKDQFGHYLASLLEGDGCIYLPSLGSTILNRVLNPRIVFTSHVNNIEMYVYIQTKLTKGRFQLVNKNTIRYIIGDIEGIMLFIKAVHNKLRTPKNKTFNQLIDFFNNKYNLTISSSNLNNSNLFNNN